MGKKKGSPGQRLNKVIVSVLRLPHTIDGFVKDNPWLNEDKAFVEAALAVKRTIQELRLPLNLITDVATQFDDKDKQEEDE